MNMPKYMILALGLVLVVAFQNCGNDMRFEQEGSLVAKADEDTDGDGIPDDPSNDDDSDDGGSGGGGGMNPGDGQPPRATPTPSPTPRNGGGTNPRNPPSSGGKDCKDKDKDCEECKDRGGDHSDDDTSQSNYLCVLDGPGKSVKLNYVSGSGAFADNSASDAACMSKNACLNVASKAFRVKLAEERGFCRNARVRLSDRQVEEAASKAKLLQLVHGE